MAWQSLNKTDLILEVWRLLERESAGAEEIEAIQTALAGRFGEGAAETPMKIARQLADAGATLRHAEIMGLHIATVEKQKYEPGLAAVFEINDLASARRALQALSELRTRYRAANDDEGMRRIRAAAIGAKEQAKETAERSNIEGRAGRINREIADWLRVWLETPEMFDNWLELRLASAEFRERFGDVG